MNVGITGGSGFAGRRLVDLHLARGDRVRVLTRRPKADAALRAGIEHHEGDLLGEPDRLRRFADGLDVLYHCAGETQDEQRMPDVNVQGTRNLVQAAAGRVGRWVQLSSVGAYGPLRSGTISEDEPLRPVGPYEVTKTEAEQQLLRDGPRLGLSFSILRPCKIMGIGMRDRSLYGLFALLARGRFFFIGKPGALLNYVHVDDVARALVLCGTHPAANGRVYNVARQITVESFVGASCAAIGCRMPGLRVPEGPVRLLAALTAWVPRNPLTIGRIDGLTGRLVYSSGRIGAELGFGFEVTIEQGLAELVEDWRRAH